ncbi:MAG: DUF3189 family protein [Bacillota bacterium]
MDSVPAKVIYHCYHGYPPSLRAASAHLRRPLAAPRPGTDLTGRLCLAGIGPDGEEVYTLARRGSGSIVSRALTGMARAFGVPADGLVVVDASRWRTPEEAVSAAYQALRRTALPRPQPRDEVWPKVVYVCYGSAHSSIVAASLHLGRLPLHRRALPAEVLAAPHFDELPHSRVGTLLEMGRDARGHRVYVLGLGPYRQALSRCLQDLAASLGAPPGSLLVVDALSGSRPTTRVGGFLSRRLGLVGVGRPLVTRGVLADYGRFTALVSGVLHDLEP